MQFAYLDDTAGAVDLMVGTLLHSLQQHRNTREQLNEDDIPEVELPEDWKKFQESLQAFQKEYMQTARCVRETEQSLVGK